MDRETSFHSDSGRAQSKVVTKWPGSLTGAIYLACCPHTPCFWCDSLMDPYGESFMAGCKRRSERVGDVELAVRVWATRGGPEMVLLERVVRSSTTQGLKNKRQWMKPPWLCAGGLAGDGWLTTWPPPPPGPLSDAEFKGSESESGFATKERRQCVNGVPGGRLGRRGRHGHWE